MLKEGRGINACRAQHRKLGMTVAEHFWYVLGFIFFDTAYFNKAPVAKALSELEQGHGPI